MSVKDRLIAGRNVLARHQFVCFVILCIVVALLMTIISLDLYRRSGAMKLDMSRPGYEKVRIEVEKSTDDQPYDSTGAFTEEAVSDFDNRIDKYQQELDTMGGYDNASITDQSLNLVNPDNGTATDGQPTDVPPAG